MLKTSDEKDGSRINADGEASMRKRGCNWGTAKGRDGGSCHMAVAMNLNEAKRRDEGVKRGQRAKTCKMSSIKQGN